MVLQPTILMKMTLIVGKKIDYPLLAQMGLDFSGADYALFNLYEEKGDIHETEPYVYSQTIAGRSSKHFGRAKNSWLTGTASWSLVAVSQYILGIRPTFNGLMIDPKLPDSIQKVRVSRYYRNSTYNILIEKLGLKNPELYIDKQQVKGNIIPSNGEGKHEVIYRY